MLSDLFKDKQGHWAILSKPNIPLITWFVSWVLSHILPYGTWNFVAALVAFGALFTWAWLELFQGASLFRRALGAAILILLIHSKI